MMMKGYFESEQNWASR